MEGGYIPEMTTGGEWITSWVAGEQRKALFGTARTSKKKDRIPIRASRCTVCGFVELFARNDSTME
jgi:hypothetical protein